MHLCQAVMVTMDGTYVRVHSPQGRSVRLSTDFVWVLAATAGGTTRDELLGAADTTVGRIKVSHVVDVLQSAEVLHEQPTCPACVRRNSWRSWSPEAELFHFGTRNVPYSAVTEESAARLASEGPRPELAKSYPGTGYVALPRVDFGDEARLSDVLLRRRTSRAFAATALTATALSDILGMTWGVWGVRSSQYKGWSLLKTSPSAGGQHPIETYVLLTRDVEGIPRGAYHYAMLDHRLKQLHVGELGPRLGEIFTAQPFVSDVPALFVMTGVFGRVMWKYPFSRAYRTLLLDAGHLGQTFCLVAEALGLRSFCTAAFHDGRLEELLGLDPTDEGALYVLGAGRATA